MYSSPVTPTGTGSNFASSTNIFALPIGLPMLGLPSSARQRLILDQIVVSVGPYALKNSRPSLQRSTNSAEQASPATITVRNSGKPSFGIKANADGGIVRLLIDCSRNNFCNGAPGKSSSGVAITSVAPVASAIVISKTEASKLNEAN